MEYKNGVNAMGNVSVSKDRVSPDVQTGRYVLVDTALYESDEGYAEKVDRCLAEGFVQIDKE